LSISPTFLIAGDRAARDDDQVAGADLQAAVQVVRHLVQAERGSPCDPVDRISICDGGDVRFDIDSSPSGTSR